MGPRSEERGNRGTASCSSAARRRFNGAALRGARKLISRRRFERRRWLLQWGRAPRSAETVNCTGGHCDRATLQWGRAPRSAETARADPRRAGDGASMGPRSEERGNFSVSSGIVFPLSKLQWGRAPRSAETRFVRWSGSRVIPCFNGAALRGARKRSLLASRPRDGARFNGAALRGARKPAPTHCKHGRSRRFNGAALRGARKHAMHRGCGERRLLQWGRAPRSAETGKVGAGASRPDGLQWGRAPRSAETRVSPRSIVTLQLLQWGRAPRSAETRHPRLGRRLDREASMGPRSEERGNELEETGGRPVPRRFNGAALRGARKRAQRPGHHRVHT